MTLTLPLADVTARPGRGSWPAAALIVGGVAAALLAHRLVPGVGVLTWALLLGAACANLGAVPLAARPGIRAATRPVLRIGVALLGLSLPIGAVAALGPGFVAVVVGSLLTTLTLTTWLAGRLGLGGPRSLLIGTGVAICGASAIAAVQEHADADEDDVAIAVAMVTLCGTVAMLVLPLLQSPLGLDDAGYGAWAGASVHEVGQVVAAAGPAGASAVSVAVVVKLTRVLMLAPVVASVSLLRRRRLRASGLSGGSAALPPIVPGFVVAFLALTGVRSLGWVPSSWLDPIALLQTCVLAAALFGMGTAVHVPSLIRGSGRVVLVSTLASVLIASMTLAGVRLLG